MLYRGRKPEIITVDDRFMCLPNRKIHAFVSLKSNEKGEREIWPMIIEKAFAKMHGSYKDIEGGVIAEAVTKLTNCNSEVLHFE